MMRQRRRITVVAPSVVAPDAPTLTAPADNADVYDGVGVTVSATVTAGQVPDRVDFVLDPGGSEVVVATDSASPYSQTWTPAGVTPGAHTLVARFVYGSGSVDSAAIGLIAFPASTVLSLRADAGVTKDGSDFVSEWLDQSPTGLVFTAAGTARPTWKSAEIGGRDSIRGDGATDIMDSTATLNLLAATGLTWFGVMKDTLGGIAGRFAFEISADSGANDGMGVIPQNGAPPDNIGAYFHGGGVLNYAGMDGTGADLAAAAVVCLTGDSTLTGASEIKGYINGTLSSQQYPLGTNMGSGFGNALVHLFARAGAVGPWPGDFAALFLCSTVLSAGDRAAMTAALGARFGITVA